MLASLVAFTLLAALIQASSAAAAGDWGPDTCIEGFVWREAFPGDHVCVTGPVRAATMSDNSRGAARRSPTGGAYGPDTCLFGFVWRDAGPNDHVCVTGAARAQAAYDNSQAAARRNSLQVWHSIYHLPRSPSNCIGDICTVEQPDPSAASRYRLHADHISIGWVTVELRRVNTRALLRTWTVYAPPAGYTPGGVLRLDTRELSCSSPHDSYFRVRDPASTRWSVAYPVSTRCALL